MSTQIAEDGMLIERARKGDRSAFDDLVYRYETRAYQYAYRLTTNAEEAGDIVADAFIRVYGALPNFKQQSSFSTWLYRIITNCFLDLRKRDKSRPATSLESTLSTEEGEMERQIEDPNAASDEHAERNERERLMQEAVALLPEYQRAMITMYHAEGLSYEEIAEALDLPIGTVKSRLNRARLSLREQLVKNEELFDIA